MAASRTLSLRSSRPLFNWETIQFGPLRCSIFQNSGPIGGTRHLSPVLLSPAKCNFHSSPTNLRVVKSPYPLQKFPEQPYFDFMFSKLDKHGHRVILVDGLSGEEFTYQDCHDLSLSFAKSLQELGAQKGDIMAILMPNNVEYPLAMFGASAVGVISTTINPTYTSGEIARQLAFSEASFVITTSGMLDALKAAIGKLDGEQKALLSGKRILVVGDSVPSSHSSASQLMRQFKGEPLSDRPEMDPLNDVCVLPFSSGTTGVPKGVMLTHYNMTSSICQTAWGPDSLKISLEATDVHQPVTVSVLPMFHIFAMNVTIGPVLYNGGKMVVLPKFEPQTFLAALEKYKSNFLHVAPPLLGFLIASPAASPALFSDMRDILAAAAPVGVSLIEKFKEKAPNVVVREGWGMTELAPAGIIASVDGAHPGSCGRVCINSEAKVVDVDSGTLLGPNQRGELAIRGPQVMKGYLKNEKATSEMIRDGWLHTGDIAIYDEQERFFIVDRLKELIKVKGFQVAPAELENLLRTHQDVMDVAVIGVPDERNGEAPRAYIVLKPSVDASEATAEKIASFVAGEVADFKRLSGGIEFLEAVPKAASGKILRKDLVAMYNTSRVSG